MQIYATQIPFLNNSEVWGIYTPITVCLAEIINKILLLYMYGSMHLSGYTHATATMDGHKKTYSK
jgi:hypothetical protein